VLSPTVIAYVGEPRRSLEVSTVLQRQAGTDLHFLTVSPDEVWSILTDDRLDGVICGGGLTSDQLQAIVDAVDEEGVDLPLFDLTDAVAAVPSSVEVHHLYATTDPERAADEMLDTVTPEDDEEMAAASNEESEQPAELALGVDPALTTDEEWQVTGWDPALTDVVAVADDPAGLPVDDAVPALADRTVHNAAERVVETGHPETVQLQVAEEQWLEVRVVPDDRRLVWFLRDVSDSKRYEQELSDARTRLHSTLDRITDAIRQDRVLVAPAFCVEIVSDARRDCPAGDAF